MMPGELRVGIILVHVLRELCLSASRAYKHAPCQKRIHARGMSLCLSQVQYRDGDRICIKLHVEHTIEGEFDLRGRRVDTVGIEYQQVPMRMMPNQMNQPQMYPQQYAQTMSTQPQFAPLPGLQMGNA